jgi:hypothetical protein
VARPTKEIEQKREHLEGQLACLGNAIRYMELAAHRLGSAIDYIGHAALLGPAVEDIETAKALARRTQQLIKDSCPPVFGSE